MLLAVTFVWAYLGTGYWLRRRLVLHLDLAEYEMMLFAWPAVILSLGIDYLRKNG